MSNAVSSLTWAIMASFHSAWSRLESAVADEGAREAGEGEEVLSLAFVAAVESAAAGEPGHGPFDGPAVSSEPL